jgi:hypothetical protein
VRTYRGVEVEADAPMGDDYCDALNCTNFATEDGLDFYPRHGNSDFRLCPCHAKQADKTPDPLDAEIAKRFASHTISQEQGDRADAIRIECARLAERIAKTVKPGREQSLALTNLEQVMFNAVAGICREGL